MEKIAVIHNDFSDKFGIPRQSGLVSELKSEIIFEKKYAVNEAVRGLEDYDYIWLIWEFSKAADKEWRPTVRPPRLGGDTRMGVFATRSPFRPNSLGLSSVKLDSVELRPGVGPVLHVSGADLMEGTPIYDIKPYLSYVDSHPEASDGFAKDYTDYHLTVEFDEGTMDRIPGDKLDALTGVLSQDPRPSYQEDPDRIYGMSFGNMNVKFKVDNGVLTVKDVELK